MEAAAARYRAGQAALEQGDQAEAAAAFEQAAEAAPTWLLPRLELASLAVARREGMAAAREALLRVAGEDSDVSRVHRVIGELHALEGDDARAVAAWQKALQLRPWDDELRSRRASALHRLGKADEAADEWMRVVRAMPGELHLRARLAMALEDAGRFDEAQAQLEDLVRRQPGKEAPVRRLARFFERRGEREAALAAHGKADKLREKPRPSRKLRPLLPSRR